MAFDIAVFDLLFIVSEHGSVVPVVMFFEEVLIVLDFSAILSNESDKKLPVFCLSLHLFYELELFEKVLLIVFFLGLLWLLCGLDFVGIFLHLVKKGWILI